MPSESISLCEIREKLQSARKKSEIMALVPLFSILGEKKIEKISRRLKLRKYKKRGEILFNKGDKAEEIYIIKSGEVTVYDMAEEKKAEKTIAVLTKGDLLGEMGVIMSAPRSLSAKITSYTGELYIISRSDFLYILNKYPELCLNLCKMLCRRLKERGESLLHLSAKTGGEIIHK